MNPSDIIYDQARKYVYPCDVDLAYRRTPVDFADKFIEINGMLRAILDFLDEKFGATERNTTPD